jgi:hypothetical protein
MEHEVRGQLQGSGAGGRAEEWHEPEPAADDTVAGGPPSVDGTLDPEEREERSRFGRYLPRSVFPADRARLLAAARGSNAPDDLVGELQRLDPRQSFATVAEVWESLGYEPDRRF